MAKEYKGRTVEIMWGEGMAVTLVINGTPYELSAEHEELVISLIKKHFPDGEMANMLIAEIQSRNEVKH